MSVTEIFKHSAEEFGISVSDELLNKLSVYASELRQWNEKINLTRIIDDDGIAKKHFIDSLSVLKYVDIKNGASIIDVGTGAGFPGLVIAAARPDVTVTLLDSTGKKLTAVGDIAEKMGVNNITLLKARAEEAARLLLHREKYDFAFARAVASLNVLSEYCLPFVKMGGSFIAMKGEGASNEIDEAASALTALGGKVQGIETFMLFDCGERNLINIKKISQNSPKYPRVSAQIAKNPL